MSEDIVKEPEVKKTKTNNTICIGLDCGTMHLVCARSDTDEVKVTRNVFLPVDKDDISLTKLSDISYVKGEDDEVFIIGSDAFEFANLFGQAVSRPMERGLISPKEISAIDVLTLMIRDLIGDIKDKEVYCSYSIPAEAIDEGRSVTYHENVFARILNSLGLNHVSVNESMAIIYSECAKEKFSGIGISFGAGMANVAISYKGIEAHTFSTARAGDWIDKQVAEALAMIPNRVTNLKEKYMKLSGEVTIKNRKTKRVLSGGTSLPEGFVNLFKNIISNYELPFEVSEIRSAKNPMTAVANGLLVRTIADVKGK